MTAIILRRRKLGRGSSKGITDVSTMGIKAVRNWRSRDWAGLGGVMDAITVFRWGCTSSLTGLINTTNSVVVNTADTKEKKMTVKKVITTAGIIASTAAVATAATIIVMKRKATKASVSVDTDAAFMSMGVGNF